MPKVSIERHVKQVVHGTRYEGKVVFDGDEEKELTYELRFSVPIPELDYATPPEGPKEVGRFIVINVKTKDGSEVELTDQQYGFFIQLLAEFACDFYNESQTQSFNKGFLGMAARGHTSAFPGLVSASFGMSDKLSWDLPVEFLGGLEEATGLALQ